MDSGGNCNKNNHLSWDLWDVGSSRFDWNGLPSSSSSSSSVSSLPPTTTSTKITTSFADLGSLHFNNFPSNRPTSPSEIHPFLLHNPTLSQQRQQNHYRYHHQEEAQEATRAHFMLPHSHFFSNNSADSLTCLKLGKRQYFEDSLEPTTDPHLSGFSMGKKNRQASPISIGGGGAVAIPRCQVEGCNVGLLNAKEYHKRHKVCEMHSKAPRVVVLGIEQRFCQQCSRFHVVSEFDDSKRSCRRRLAGHNERRRKNSSDSINRNHSQVENKIGDRYLLPCATPSAARALSLLSTKTASWVSQADLSVRSSAALRELIAENRAAVLAKQLLSDRGLHGLDDSNLNFSHVQQLQLPGFHSHESVSHMCSGISLRPTLDLMQTANSSFPILSTSRSKEDEEEREIWKSLEGTHIV